MQVSNGHEKSFKVEKKSSEKRREAYPGIIIRQSAFFSALVKDNFFSLWLVILKSAVPLGCSILHAIL